MTFRTDILAAAAGMAIAGAAADRAALIELYAEKGVMRGAGMLEEFEGLLRKWVGLTRDVTDADILADLYCSALYSRVDVAAHGG